ncbi:uncharacterized protein [Nicotiana tomentosiformis]|uniref:uncharacterized protein n=1 Tax=Nicotiana tomentosiformis TaxID=4098 RepID=UPI00388CC7FE
MEAINEWRGIATKSTERLEYLEQGLMDDMSGIRKDNAAHAENVETSDGRSTPTQNDMVLRLEQKILELQGELEHVQSAEKDLLIKNIAEELKKLTSRVQGVEGGKGIEGLNYEDLCIQPDVEVPEDYKPPKFKMFDGTGDPKVHLRTYCDKLVGVGKDERICMKLFMRSLTGDALSWYISQNPKKWINWVSMASAFVDRFRFNTENAPDVFYIQNLKKNPTETFREYATRWRSETTKVRPALEEEQMNRFFVRAQDPQYYERLIVIENHKFSDIIKLRERIEERIKSGMAKETAPNVRNNPLLDHRGEGVNVIETDEEWDPEGSIWLIREEDDPKMPVTLMPIVVQIQSLIEVDVAAPTSFEVEDYTAKARRKVKGEMEETGATQGMTRTGRVYTPEHLGETNKEAASRQPIIETGSDDLWRKVKARDGEMDNMVGQVLESHKITFHEDELPPEGLSHNRALHIIVQCEDKFIARVLIDRGSSLNIYPLNTLKRLGKGLHEI